MRIAGAGAGVCAAGCLRDLPQKLIPYVVAPDEIIPGVAAWYAGTCFECAAHCGTLVRVREGRAVKIEGNPLHPVNSGGLCALGQSAVQAAYDPDRLREPMRRNADGSFSAVPWNDALYSAAEAIARAREGGKRVVLISEALSLSEAALAREFCGKTGAEHLQYQVFPADEVEQAASAVFGAGVRADYDLSRADCVVSFGADYLGTWRSPVEFTRARSTRRAPDAEKGGTAAIFPRAVHFEPRLSLTAANADRWYKTAAGSECSVLGVLFRKIVEYGGWDPAGQDSGRVAKKNVRSAAVRYGMRLCAGDALHPGCGVTESEIEALARELGQCRAPLIICGGPVMSGADGERAMLISLLLNIVLGAAGKTVRLCRASAEAKLPEVLSSGLSARLAEGPVPEVLIVAQVNPFFTLPEKSGFSRLLERVPFVVSLSVNLDETAERAHLVMPLSTTIETWRDSEVRPGVYALNQPAMQPLYQTQSLGDTLISLCAAAPLGVRFAEDTCFYDYMRRAWKERIGADNFEEQWLRFVELGGDFGGTAQESISDWSLNPELEKVISRFDVKNPESSPGLSLLAFPTPVFGDGHGANRPWLQELPDPVSTVVWGSWIEVHPETLKRFGIPKNSCAKVITDGGELEAPVLATEHIDPGLVAVPVGQGHAALGRFCRGVGVNPLAVLGAGSGKSAAGFIASGVRLERSALRQELLQMQGSDSQLGRGIIRTVELAVLQQSAAVHKIAMHKESHNTHDVHALGPRTPPKQMYVQAEHPQYQWAMSVDLSKCTGCCGCVAACYAENNIAVSGRKMCAEGREMSWLRIERFLDGPPEHPVLGFLPMMCQHCNNAPCEPVCPVYATYHSDEGLNTMVYNRCVGTRYCANNCSYKARRFNWVESYWPEPLNWQLNPDVTVRCTGVMEKCTFCIQRIREAENRAKDEGREVRDGEIQPACASSCPAGAIVFGNLKDPHSAVYRQAQLGRSYKVLDAELNTQPAVTYLAKISGGKAK